MTELATAAAVASGRGVDLIRLVERLVVWAAATAVGALLSAVFEPVAARAAASAAATEAFVPAVAGATGTAWVNYAKVSAGRVLAISWRPKNTLTTDRRGR